MEHPPPRVQGNDVLPDIGALYLRYRVVLRAVADSVLRDTPQRDQVEDVVMEVLTSLRERPPEDPVRNWEAFLVRATRNKATDVLRSAAVRHHGGPLEDVQHPQTDQFIAEDVAERVDDERAGAAVWHKLSLLDSRDRRILWEYKARGRRREDVAREFRITPARVSQISTASLKILREALLEEGHQP